MKRFKNILCILDPQGLYLPPLERAVTLAENNQARLTLAAVAPEAAVKASAGLQASLESRLLEALENLADPYRRQAQIDTRVLAGTAFLEIIREVLRRQHDLLIKMPEQQNWLTQLFGSEDMHLLRKCPCPVWMIKQQVPAPFRCILAAVDVEDDYPPEEQADRDALNRQILELSGSLAVTEFAELHIVHAWDAMGEGAMNRPFMHTSEEEIAAYVEQVRRDRAARLEALEQQVLGNLAPDVADYLEPETHLVKGTPRQAIPALARLLQADLVVMGTVGRTGIPGFIIGNTAETILGQIDCSVLAVKPPGFVSPVTLEA